MQVPYSRPNEGLCPKQRLCSELESRFGNGNWKPCRTRAWPSLHRLIYLCDRHMHTGRATRVRADRQLLCPSNQREPSPAGGLTTTAALLFSSLHGQGILRTRIPQQSAISLIKKRVPARSMPGRKTRQGICPRHRGRAPHPPGAVGLPDREGRRPLSASLLRQMPVAEGSELVSSTAFAAAHWAAGI